MDEKNSLEEGHAGHSLDLRMVVERTAADCSLTNIPVYFALLVSLLLERSAGALVFHDMVLVIVTDVLCPSSVADFGAVPAEPAWQMFEL